MPAIGRCRCRPVRCAGTRAGRRSSWPRTGLGLACALLLTACASADIAHLPKAGADTPCIRPAAPQDTIVGVSFSGGGSRAALFGASALEALARMPAP